MGFQNWETPPDFFAKLSDELHFTYDAAASDENYLCRTYSTEKYTRQVVPSGDVIGEVDQDGLTFSWLGERVFCNPPYHDVAPWVDKALKREAELAVLLLPPSMDVAWMHKILSYCERKEDWLKFGGQEWTGWVDRDHSEGQPRVTLAIMKGRMKFYHPALRPGFPLKHHKYFGDAIFDFEKPHVPGPSPTQGNVLLVVRK